MVLDMKGCCQQTTSRNVCSGVVVICCPPVQIIVQQHADIVNLFLSSRSAYPYPQIALKSAVATRPCLHQTSLRIHTAVQLAVMPAESTLADRTPAGLQAFWACYCHSIGVLASRGSRAVPHSRSRA